MTIETHTPDLEEHQRSLLKLLAWRYPAEAVSHFPEKDAMAISAAVEAGQLFATFHTSEVFLNALTSSHRDSVVGTPECKITAVQIERLTEERQRSDGGSP